MATERIYKAVDETGKEYVFQSEQKGNSLFLTLKKELFSAAKKLWVLKDLSKAKAGDEGYYLVPRTIVMMGDMRTYFCEREDYTYTQGVEPIMSMYVLKLENLCALVRIERNYKYRFEICWYIYNYPCISRKSSIKY